MSKKYRVVHFQAYINGTTLTITNQYQRIPWVDEYVELDPKDIVWTNDDQL